MAKYFLIGSYVNAEYLNYSLDVAENELHINGQSTSYSGIQRVEITESDGIVEIAIRTVEKSLFYSRSFEETFQSTLTCLASAHWQQPPEKHTP